MLKKRAKKRARNHLLLLLQQQNASFPRNLLLLLRNLIQLVQVAKITERETPSCIQISLDWITNTYR